MVRRGLPLPALLAEALVPAGLCRWVPGQRQPAQQRAQSFCIKQGDSGCGLCFLGASARMPKHHQGAYLHGRDAGGDHLVGRAASQLGGVEPAVGGCTDDGGVHLRW
jgi:hypothetical protein